MPTYTAYIQIEDEANRLSTTIITWDHESRAAAIVAASQLPAVCYASMDAEIAITIDTIFNEGGL